jgi:hypothetical protein
LHVAMMDIVEENALTNGECSSQADCGNPDNQFTLAECDEAGTGILECNDLDRCWIQCP